MEIVFIFIWGIAALVMVSIHIYEGVIVHARKNPKSWIPVPCEILESDLENDTDSDGPKFWVEIQYKYKYENTNNISKKYGLNYLPSSYKRSHKKIFDNYPKGAKSICYVNPKEPSEAVLNRSISMGLFSIIILAIFLILGIGMLLYALLLFIR
ncbi:MAG: DUF3592 domain-containing protein [Planctomycetota bacterium]|jgi:hypothetical protein